MAKLFDLVKVNITTPGNVTVTFGAKVTGFLTPAEAGAIDGDQPRYIIRDGNDFEEGTGTIVSGVTAMARTTVKRSMIAGVVGTTKLSLSGAAVMAFTVSADDILNPADNLSNLSSASASRTSLGLGSAAVRADTHFPRTDTAQSLTSTQQKQARSNAGVNDFNLIDNGDFRFNARGFVSYAMTAGQYGHERWKAGASGANYGYSSATLPNTLYNLTGSLIQVIPAEDVEGGSYVLSWEGTAKGRVGINSATPSGGYAISPILITGQAARTVMSVEFSEPMSSLGKVKLEEGTVATPFSIGDVAVAKRRCERGYRRIKNPPGAGLGNGGSALYYWSFPLDGEMFGPPAVSISGPLAISSPIAGGTIVGISANLSSSRTFMANATTGASVASGFAMLTNNTNELILDADI